MSRTVGHTHVTCQAQDWWSGRPYSYQGMKNSRWTKFWKRLCHRTERRIARQELRCDD